ncbi:hypothetical protein ElyMa_004376000 [Elysia marginata]|uniref:Uncharacterized protein n=1 Tax=Elysia marginata TaxID=1093978 RepID=A0AAV4H6D0_9GAST|nr:hypothetical protein ElyMa_004376000 [Elysia marginata]
MNMTSTKDINISFKIIHASLNSKPNFIIAILNQKPTVTTKKPSHVKHQAGLVPKTIGNDIRVIKNNVLYQKTGETPISLIILEERWRLFGQILRTVTNTPPKVAMTKYFKTEGSKRRGRPKTSIVTILRGDLKSHNSDHWPTKLDSIKDLDHLRNIAQNRSDWKQLSTAIYRSAQAETSVDVAEDGH